jgi:hypothetical protein
MAQFDTEIADGLWDGLPPADAPAWCSDIASLIGIARGPATEDELAAEDQIVALMAEAILEAAVAEAAEAEEAADLADDTDATDATDAAEREDHESPAAVTLALVPSLDESEPTVVVAAEAEAETEVAVETEVAAATEIDVAAEAETEVAAQDETKAVAAAVTEAEVAEGDAETGGGVDGAAVAAAAERIAYPLHLKQKQYGETGRRLRVVRRVVAVKAVATTAAVAIGITAAAAATGVVVSVVDPPRWGAEVKETSTSSTSPGATVTIDVRRRGSGEGPGEDSDDSPTKQLTCVLNFGCKDPLKVLGPQAAKVPVLVERAEELAETTTTIAGQQVTPPQTLATTPDGPLPATPTPPTTDAPAPQTTTTVPEVTTTTTAPEVTTTTTAPPSSTTSSTPPTSDTTPDPGPGTLSVTEP